MSNKRTPQIGMRGLLVPSALGTIAATVLIVFLLGMLALLIAYGVAQYQGYAVTLNGAQVTGWGSALYHSAILGVLAPTSTFLVVMGIYGIIVAAQWVRVWVGAGATRGETFVSYLVAVGAVAIFVLLYTAVSYWLVPAGDPASANANFNIILGLHSDARGVHFEVNAIDAGIDWFLYMGAGVIGFMLSGFAVGVAYVRFHWLPTTVVVVISAVSCISLISVTTGSGMLGRSIWLTIAAGTVGVAWLLVRRAPLARRVS